MKLVKPKSLAETLDAVNEAFFYNRSLPESERERVAKWIAGRQGKPGSYANMFAPTTKDYKEGARLFTGEMVRSGAATGHILGEEACRALILLDVRATAIRDALHRASVGMIGRLDYPARTDGWYCCGTCTSSYWRHLAVGGLENTERELAAGMKNLKKHRSGDGKWKRYPFYYTLLALSELDFPSAINEMKYAAGVCERLLKRTPKNEIAQRRRDLVERILEKL